MCDNIASLLELNPMYIATKNTVTVAIAVDKFHVRSCIPYSYTA